MFHSNAHVNALNISLKVSGFKKGRYPTYNKIFGFEHQYVGEKAEKNYIPF